MRAYGSGQDQCRDAYPASGACARLSDISPNFLITRARQLISTHVRDGKLERESLKAIYVAPMKALAQEVVATFGERLAPLQVRVRDIIFSGK